MKGVLDLLARLVPSNALRIRLQRAKGVKIGQNVYLGYDTHIDTAYPDLVEIEDHARVAIGAVVLAHSRPADAWMAHMGEHKAAVRIKRHAAVYAGAILTPGVTVGEYAIVKEGAVVVEDVPPFTVVAGVPARVIEQLPKEKATGGARGQPP